MAVEGGAVEDGAVEDERSVTEIVAVLGKIAERCANSAELDDALGPCLRWMAERLGLVRGTLSLLDDERHQIWIEAAHGLTPAEIRRVRLAPGEGITGQVIASGKPVIIEQISAEPRFMDWRGLRDRGEDPAFVSVPILGAEQRSVGALSACRFAEADLAKDVHTLTVIAGLLAPLVRGTPRQLAAPYAGNRPDKQLQPDNLIGRSKAMRAVFEMLGQVAGSEATVLILGESGTGKELVANALHHHSARKNGTFVKVNCAALPQGVIESELFGHEKGSFTGALRQHQGKFERARGGTIFLDEVGELPLTIQVKLLRVLQEGEFERVGGAEALYTDARIIAATSRDLETMIAAGDFRADLFYRLNVFPIWLPALRERKADILLLADHFIERSNHQYGRQVRRLSTSAIDMLVAYHWPGNVRELENCIERAVLLAEGDVILGHHLPPTLQTAEASNTAITAPGLRPQVEAFEKDLIIDALKSARGNMAAAARQLRISERIMGLRVKKYAINPNRFKIRR